MVCKQIDLDIFALRKYSLVHMGYERKVLKTVRKPTDCPRAKWNLMFHV